MSKKTWFVAAVVGVLGVAGSALSETLRFRLESEDGRRKSRSIDIGRDGVVVLVGQLSNAPCRFGRTWGYDRDRVWVDDGCRGIFEVRDKRDGWERGSRVRYVRLESRDGRRTTSGNLGRHNWVRISSQLSETRCVRDRNWGVRGNRIWVDGGCRAVFAVNARS